MLSSINRNQPSFKSIIPLHVYVNGEERIDPKTVRAACRKLSGILTGPAKGNELNEKVIRQFAEVDPDYSILDGLYGHSKLPGEFKVLPSDNFRLIEDYKGYFYVTGDNAKTLRKMGKDIGIELAACKERGLKTSPDLQVAKQNYKYTLRNLLYNRNIRVKERYDLITRERLGRPLELIIHLVENAQRKLSFQKISFFRNY